MEDDIVRMKASENQSGVYPTGADPVTRKQYVPRGEIIIVIDSKTVPCVDMMTSLYQSH